MNSEGDLVLIYYQDKPAGYARIEAIEPDIKKVWYQITLLLLSIPAQTVTWILRAEYVNSAVFTMGGQEMRLEKVEKVTASAELEDPETIPGQKGKDRSLKVIPLKKRS